MPKNKYLKVETQIALKKRYFIAYFFVCFSFLGYAQTSPNIKTKVDTTSIRIGEQLIWTVSVDTDSTSSVIFPEGQTFSPLETVEAFTTDTTRKKDRLTLIKSYALTQFDSGSYKLPPQLIEINGKGFFTDSTRISVANIPVDTLNQKMYDIKPIIPVEESNSDWWKIALGVLLGILIIGGLLYWFFSRKKPLSEEEKVALLPAYDRALLELKQLENSRYLIQDEYKKYYSELTDIVRSYLEEDVQVSALESTTDQLITKLELMSDAGDLELDKDTISQFKRVLQTADLVKFAKTKPETSVAEQDRKAIENIVVKTHNAIPEPTEEELLQQEAYLEALAIKEKKKRLKISLALLAGFLLISCISAAYYFGFEYTKDTILRHPTKLLLESEWVQSSYGYPPIKIETPKILKREEIKLTPELKGVIKELQKFSYHSPKKLFTITAVSTTFANPQQEPDFGKEKETQLQQFQAMGAKNIIAKEEEYKSLSGIKGIKFYGSGKFKDQESNELVSGKYTFILFGGKGFQQALLLTWLKDDIYAQKIVDRILATLEVKNQV